MVTLRFATSPADDAQLVGLDVPERPFTTPPATVLNRVADNPHMRCVLIEDGGEVAGYFALETGPTVAEISAREGDVFLRTLAIGQAKRRRGIARATLTEALYPFVACHYPEAVEVFLLVSEANVGAHRLYVACGFRDTGFRKMGPWGRQHVLAHPVRARALLP